ncbi:hypothetical protein [Nannocystis punicea]|uniref:Uncharacterized protein n=1 Tax=Nannocystis punicea TaxID=2995304 RepID=A0ABY7HER6_9BACT|nr:hypothetical protein [Nannocystis poenicansa]WAS97519.1 hypothetical protein O0S08_15345 [Nannocystis poenicansa]
MISWRTLACSVSVLCLALPACGDDGEPGSSFGTANNNSNTNNTTDTSSGTDTSTGAPGTSSTTGDPTTGPDTTSTTATPTTNGPTTTLTSTTLPDTTTTGDIDPSTTTTTTQTTDPAGCGNGQIDPNEQCDGANLNGFTCESLGNAGGSLGCDPVTCTFDTSLCMGNSSSGTSG